MLSVDRVARSDMGLQWGKEEVYKWHHHLMVDENIMYCFAPPAHNTQCCHPVVRLLKLQTVHLCASQYS